MGYIKLEGMEFYAYHGYYESERQVGNHYKVDIELKVPFSLASSADELSGTVNYEDIYNIVAAEMKSPVKLLEFLGKKILDQVLRLSDDIQEAKVSIYKITHP